MDKQNAVLSMLRNFAIDHEAVAHQPVHTISEMESLNIDANGSVPKNLFLRDEKGRNYFLVIADKARTIDLKALRKELGTSGLSFASEEKLAACLNLTPGAVTPFGIIHDTEHKVVVVIDRALLDLPRLGFHPNENTATVFLAPGDLLRFFALHNTHVRYMD